MTASTAPRMTPQRQAVLEVLHASDDHPTAADVYDRVRQIHPGIGAATVYRSLAVLVESGHALELALGDGSSARYDGNVTRHDHVVCVSCGRAIDVKTPLLTSAVRTLSRDTGFVITGYDLQFRGRCPRCETT
jgi:Fur family ferric uptake transcriptional regulator/Fur family peroxide stress response transcriptional regulator